MGGRKKRRHSLPKHNIIVSAKAVLVVVEVVEIAVIVRKLGTMHLRALSKMRKYKALDFRIEKVWIMHHVSTWALYKSRVLRLEKGFFSAFSLHLSLCVHHMFVGRQVLLQPVGCRWPAGLPRLHHCVPYLRRDWGTCAHQGLLREIRGTLSWSEKLCRLRHERGGDAIIVER